MLMKIRLFIFAISCTLLISLFIIFYLPGYSHYQELSNREAELLNEVDAYKTTNEKLVEELELLRSDISYLEKLVRDRMGLVKPGEEIYKIVEESVDQAGRSDE
jgi:cell division protein FtsB